MWVNHQSDFRANICRIKIHIEVYIMLIFLLQALDKLILYLRVVHSIDYYNGSDYPHEDEMPNRCGILHVRGEKPERAASAEGKCLPVFAAFHFAYRTTQSFPCPCEPRQLVVFTSCSHVNGWMACIAAIFTSDFPRSKSNRAMQFFRTKQFGALCRPSWPFPNTGEIGPTCTLSSYIWLICASLCLCCINARQNELQHK